MRASASVWWTKCNDILKSIHIRCRYIEIIRSIFVAQHRCFWSRINTNAYATCAILSTNKCNKMFCKYFHIKNSDGFRWDTEMDLRWYEYILDAENILYTGVAGFNVFKIVACCRGRCKVISTVVSLIGDKSKARFLTWRNRLLPVLCLTLC